MQRARLLEGLVFLLLFLLTRVILLAAISSFVNEREFSDDIDNQLVMIADPLLILRGDAANRYRSHPPLLPLAEAFVTWPLQRLGVSDFRAFRGTCIAYELLLAGFMWATLGRWRTRQRHIALGCLTLLPAGWVASAIFGQDEVIAGAFLAAAVWAISRGQPRAGLAICSVGVVAGKIYLLVPLLAFLVLLRGSRLSVRLLAGLAPLVLVQGGVLLVAAQGAASTPLIEWVPRAQHGVNLWPLLVEQLGWSADRARSVSAPIAALLALAPLCIAWQRRVSAVESASLVAASMLAVVLAAFYHTTPEYFLLLSPLVLCATRDLRVLGVLAASGASAWATNLFWAVHLAGRIEASPGKQTFLDAYARWVPVDGEVGWVLGMAATTALSLALAWLCLRGAIGSPGEIAAE